MKNLELREKINKVAEELFPDLLLDFAADMSQMCIFCAYIRIATPILIDKTEAIRNLSNKQAIKCLLQLHTKMALIKSRDCIQKELDKLEKL